MPRSAYTKKKNKAGKWMYRNPKGELISEKKYNMAKSRQKSSAKTKNRKSRAVKSSSRRKQ